VMSRTLAATAVIVPVLLELIWGDRNCAIEYCGPMWLLAAWPLVAALFGGLLLCGSAIRTRAPAAALSVALAVMVPLSILAIVDLYEGEWTPNVEGDAAVALES
jgi:hypothetical protein